MGTPYCAPQRGPMSAYTVYLQCIVTRHIAMSLHMLSIHLNVRIWFEWIDSDSNPADGLSREGPDDAWTLQQAWQVEEASPIDFLPDLAWLQSFFPM